MNCACGREPIKNRTLCASCYTKWLYVFFILTLPIVTAETVTFRVQGNNGTTTITFDNATTTLSGNTFDQTFTKNIEPPAPNTTFIIDAVSTVVNTSCKLNETAISNQVKTQLDTGSAAQLDQIKTFINDNIKPDLNKLADLEGNATNCAQQITLKDKEINNTRQALNDAQENVEEAEDDAKAANYALIASIIVLIAFLTFTFGGRLAGYVGWKRGPA